MGLTVLGRATSSNVQAVMWGLAELGLTAERLDYGHVHGGVDTPEFLALNPNGLVPVLRDGDLVMWESSAILRYLAARYGDGGAFWPADPVARAPVDMWAEWGKTTFGAAFITSIFWPRVRIAARDRDVDALNAAVRKFGRLVAILEAQLGTHPYVNGDTPSLADIVVGTMLYRYFTIDIARPDAPVLRAYYERLCARPAYRTHVMVDFAALAHPEA